MKHKHNFLLLGVVLVIAIIILVITENKKALAGMLAQLTPGKLPTGSAGSAGAISITSSSFPLQPGSTGAAVKMIQAAIGVPITGIWDAATTTAINNGFSLLFSTGGIITLNDFSNFFAQLTPTEINKYFPLQTGSNNGYVKDVQILTGVSVDGIWGPNTNAAVLKATGKTSLTYNDFIILVDQVLGLTLQPQTAIIYSAPSSPVITSNPYPDNWYSGGSAPIIQPYTGLPGDLFDQSMIIE